ncbi:MAG: hypothetical protein AAF674_19720 [Pseudomonadota bacterium]
MSFAFGFDVTLGSTALGNVLAAYQLNGLPHAFGVDFANGIYFGPDAGGDTVVLPLSDVIVASTGTGGCDINAAGEGVNFGDNEVVIGYQTGFGLTGCNFPGAATNLIASNINAFTALSGASIVDNPDNGVLKNQTISGTVGASRFQAGFNTTGGQPYHASVTFNAVGATTTDLRVVLNASDGTNNRSIAVGVDCTANPPAVHSFQQFLGSTGTVWGGRGTRVVPIVGSMYRLELWGTAEITGTLSGIEIQPDDTGGTNSAVIHHVQVTNTDHFVGYISPSDSPNASRMEKTYSIGARCLAAVQSAEDITILMAGAQMEDGSGGAERNGFFSANVSGNQDQTWSVFDEGSARGLRFRRGEANNRELDTISLVHPSGRSDFRIGVSIDTSAQAVAGRTAADAGTTFAIGVVLNLALLTSMRVADVDFGSATWNRPLPGGLSAFHGNLNAATAAQLGEFTNG